MLVKIFMFRLAAFVGLLALSFVTNRHQLSASPVGLAQEADDFDHADQQEKEMAEVEGGRSANNLASSVRSLQSRAVNKEEWLMKMFGDILNIGAGAGKETTERFIERLAGPAKLFAILAPALTSNESSHNIITSTITSTTSTTSTTTPAPGTIRQMSRSLQSIGSVLTNSGAKMLGTPMRMIDGLLHSGANLTRAGALGLDQATDSLVATSNVVSQQVGGSISEPPLAYEQRPQPGRVRPSESRPQTMFDDDWKYYEYAGPYEPYAFRRPKYFSRECPFRFACEVGKLIKPVTYKVTKKFEANRFIQDLQNRYTRAITYGTVRGDCERYYCVLVKMMGGPVGFAGGVAEIVNRALNSDLYGDFASSQKRDNGLLAWLTRTITRKRSADQEEYSHWDY